MWDLLERFPGVVVLHDLFLGDATYYRSEHGTDPLLGLPMRLYADHGYGALADFSRTKDIQAAIQDYPYSLNLIQAALGVVVHSTHAKALAAHRYATNSSHFFARAFSDSLTLCMNVCIQTASLEFFALISLGKVFADLLRNADLLGKGGVMRHRLHQVVLGW
jgi:hypothetical protein